MPTPILLVRVLAFCKDRSFSSVDPIANAFPDAGYKAVETAVVDAIQRGSIRRTMLMDGPVVAISHIRG